jgi:hypothetical protein
VVFLFHEFHRPRRVSIARTQGLLSANADQGPLARMANLTSKPPELAMLCEGHLLRWTKQMAHAVTAVISTSTVFVAIRKWFVQVILINTSGLL